MAYPLRDEQPVRGSTWGTWVLLTACVCTFAFLQPAVMQRPTPSALRDFTTADLQIRAFQDRWGMVPCEITHGRSIAEGAACNGYPVDEPESYTDKNVWLPLFTAMFLHAGLAHLLGNLLFLWVFGRALEARIGGVGVIALFLAGGLAAFLGYVAVVPEGTSPVLGASGAVAAVMGAYLVLQPARRVLGFVYAAGLQVIYLPAWALLGFFLVSQFFTMQTPWSQVAWQAHVAGMVFGIVVAAVWRHFDPTLGSSDAERSPLEPAAVAAAPTVPPLTGPPEWPSHPPVASPPR